MHLAVHLAAQGRRVALVDCDPQGDCSSWLLGGDPGLGRRPWRPMLYLAERTDAKPEEN